MGNESVFIGNLVFGINEEEVRKLLSDCGTIVDIKMRKKKGYAFVQMSSEEEAALAVEKVNGVMFKDREVRVSLKEETQKAKTKTKKRYKEIGDAFEKLKKHKEPDNVRDNDSDNDSGFLSGEESTDSYAFDSDSFDSESKFKSDYSGRRSFNRSSRNDRSSDFGNRPRKDYSGKRSASSAFQRVNRLTDRRTRDTSRSNYNDQFGYDNRYDSHERSSGYGDRQRRNFSDRGTSYSGYKKREWSGNRSSRDSGQYDTEKRQRRDSGYNSFERSSGYGDRPNRDFSRNRTSSGNKKHDWSGNRSSRDGERSGFSGWQRRDSGYSSRERSSGSGRNNSSGFSRRKKY